MWRSSLFAALLATAGAVAQDTSAEAVTIEQLGWLAGCWRYDGRDDGSVEHWLPPAGGAMLAVTRVIRDDRMVSYEFLRVEETRDGSLRLIAAPVGQTVTAFALSAIETGAVAFENLQHDFPQRISYRLVDDDRLIARAEATTDDGDTGIDFPMTRSACDQDD